MKVAILGSIAALALTGCAQLDRPLGACTNVVYHNESTPIYGTWCTGWYRSNDCTC